jgi:beta-phosphoglucomutase-like phosphatase (HAD superfamily)
MFPPVRPPPLPHQVGFLQAILDRVANGRDGVPPLVVFDLDGTLYDNRPRTLQILMEYADEVRGEFPDVAAALATLEVSRVRYLLTDTLRECSLTHVDVVRDVTQYWRERFFTDDYQAYDVVIDGAPEFVRGCHETGATIVYLTGRDIPGMMLGTMSSLRDHGFPVAIAGVEVVLKPEAQLADEAFKRGALPTLRRVGDVVAFFDNEPANCNVAKSIYPDAAVGMLDTQSVPGAPAPDQGVELISDFRLV